MTLAMPTPSRRPSSSTSRRAGSSPSLAAATTALPSSKPCWRPRAPRAVPEASASSEPGCGARSATSGSPVDRSAPMSMWPSSGAAPVAPRKTRPSMTTPPPTPVPTVSITRLRTSLSSASASAATLASLSTKTGTPRRSESTSRRGTSASGMFTLERTRPVSHSITEGTPRPTAAIPSSPAARLTAATIWSRSLSVSPRSVGSTWASPRRPPSSAAAETLVPPTSTPITRSSPTAGILSLPLRIARDLLADERVHERADEQDDGRDLQEGEQDDDRGHGAEGRARVGDLGDVEPVGRPGHQPADDDQRGAEAHPAQGLGRRRREADEQRDGQPQQHRGQQVAGQRPEDPADHERAEVQHRDRRDQAGTAGDRQPRRAPEALQGGPAPLALVDRVEGRHHGAHGRRGLPEHEQRADRHPEQLAARQHHAHGGVQDLEDRRRHPGRDLGRQVVAPQRVEREQPGQREHEERERDQRVERAEGDRAGADGQLRAAEAVDDLRGGGEEPGERAVEYALQGGS